MPPNNGWSEGHFDAVVVCIDNNFSWPKSGLQAGWPTQGIGLEILGKVYIEYTKKRLALEDSQYPQYRHSMAQMLYNKNSNFHSKLKRAATTAVHQHYKELHIPEGVRWTLTQHHKSCKEFATMVPYYAVGLVTAAIKVVLIAYQDHGQPKVPTINEDSCG
ncbi:hypothetical protein HYDPIDRAFT_168199 [Hydnomerulius pinastri MD-312]|uniref:DUF6830 domain-containing protein n=1 Tax=Hydnomerulius pinastri MD-312 TaxID=994086 RepID=A0A0C9VDY5_9AGAM|nr:hypothetical protein HYDPIDRAFT_168199 [Hydnomerulius pinastri MD-312]